ncbi:hypothetical protein KSW81_004141, partial [Nannochloris sp. 'desiccata']
ASHSHLVLQVVRY